MIRILLVERVEIVHKSEERYHRTLDKMARILRRTEFVDSRMQ